MNRPAIYSRPAGKPMFIHRRRRDLDAPAPEVDNLAQPITVDKATECHVTPDDVAARMVEYLGPVGDFATLEPSAGTGQLARALLASGHSKHELTLIERHNTLASGLHGLGPVINRCFLEYAEQARGKVEFFRVIMNPPFKQCRAHVRAALSLMGQCGHEEPPTLVALVPVTFQHDDAVELERLPDDTFALARVNTKIIRIELEG